MGKIKYELIPTEEGINYNRNLISRHGIIKLILIGLMLLALACYNFFVTVQRFSVQANNEGLEQLLTSTLRNIEVPSIKPNVITKTKYLIAESTEVTSIISDFDELPNKGEEQFLTSTLQNIKVSSTKYTNNKTIKLITVTQNLITEPTEVTNELTNERLNTVTELYTNYTTEISLFNETMIKTNNVVHPVLRNKAYFVDSPQCIISALNPFSADVLKIFNKKSYSKCDKSTDSISVIYNKNNRTYQLHKNDANSTCCFKRILRSGERTLADMKYKLQSCIEFKQDFLVPQNVEEMITECRRKNQSKIWQKDAFSFVHPIVKNISMDGRPSVLLWGIDSLSRMNFQRTMPLMHNYLKSQHWFELQGYNKMGDNTFPNLMAILTGMNNSRSFNICRPHAVGGLDGCPMLWKKYKSKGYATAYGEDWGKVSTFVYNKRGFRKTPTDVYLRPMILALEKELKAVTVSGIPYCLGRRHSAEYIYDAAVQFSQVYKDQPSFGMFWTNSFSHNNFAMPAAMDKKMVEYMRKLDNNGIMENTIIIFFSDHGMRFGPLRKLKSGFLEERLPIMYLRIPKWFREKYKKFMINLEQNRNRLTSPYDIHATLKHVLELEAPSEELPRPEACPTCHSVFEEISYLRNCKQAGLNEQWCACQQMTEMPINDTLTIKIAERLVDKLNEFFVKKKLKNRCQHLKLAKIQSAQRNSDMATYRVQFTVKPHNALLEATGIWNSSAQTISTKVDEISRLDSYKDDSKCIADEVAKKYCICGK